MQKGGEGTSSIIVLFSLLHPPHDRSKSKKNLMEKTSIWKWTRNL